MVGYLCIRESIIIVLEFLFEFIKSQTSIHLFKACRGFNAEHMLVVDSMAIFHNLTCKIFSKFALGASLGASANIYSTSIALHLKIFHNLQNHDTAQPATVKTYPFVDLRVSM